VEKVTVSLPVTVSPERSRKTTDRSAKDFFIPNGPWQHERSSVISTPWSVLPRQSGGSGPCTVVLGVVCLGCGKRAAGLGGRAAAG
jgi:hypothetical protein